MRIDFKQTEKETGLAAVCAGPRGYRVFLRMSPKEPRKDIGCVSAAYREGDRRNGYAWGFHARIGEAFINSWCEGKTYEDRETAKEACKAWILANLNP